MQFKSPSQKARWNRIASITADVILVVFSFLIFNGLRQQSRNQRFNK
jgi:hypothetical protein